LMRRRYQSAKLQRIDDILHKTLKKHHIPIKMEDRRLRSVWFQAVGPRIAAHTHPGSIKKAVLFVKVANSVWMQQLHFMKQDILEKFNHLNSRDPVKDIFFAIGEIPASVAEKKDQVFIASELPALKARDKKMIEESLAEIADEELRDILKRAMKKEITRRRMMEKRQDH
jgi:predicted nucleic acid-binding Zn ribbon protein